MLLLMMMMHGDFNQQQCRGTTTSRVVVVRDLEILSRRPDPFETPCLRWLSHDKFPEEVSCVTRYTTAVVTISHPMCLRPDVVPLGTFPSVPSRVVGIETR